MKSIKYFFLFFLILISQYVFSGTLFDSDRKTSDPFFGESAGVKSLFVNPAGSAGKSGFELLGDTGILTTINDANMLWSFGNAAVTLAQTSEALNSGSLESLNKSFNELFNKKVINSGLINSIFDGTDLDPDLVNWHDYDAVKAAADNLDQNDADIIQNNLEGIEDGSNTEFYSNLPGKVRAEAVANFKTGFLVKGFGLGIYDEALAVSLINADPTDPFMGIDSIYNELGIIAGGGFNLFEGKLAVGITGNYGILMRNSDPVSFMDAAALLNDTDSINYGYNWGVDIGLIWRPVPSMGIGIVFNNIVGDVQTNTPYTANGILGFINSGAYIPDSINWGNDFEISGGLLWHEKFKVMEIKAGFDIFNIISYSNAVIDNDDNFGEALLRTLDYTRFGVNMTFFKFLKLGFQYYNRYMNAGLGFDLKFFEIYAEYKISDEFMTGTDIRDIPMGADLLLRLHF